jgi:hypothetical protein
MTKSAAAKGLWNYNARSISAVEITSMKVIVFYRARISCVPKGKTIFHNRTFLCIGLKIDIVLEIQ